MLQVVEGGGLIAPGCTEAMLHEKLLNDMDGSNVRSTQVMPVSDWAIEYFLLILFQSC